MTIRCGNRLHNTDISDMHHHETVAQVRLCFARFVASLEEEEADYQDELSSAAAYEAELGYERWLETRWADEFRAEEAYENMVYGV